MKSKSQQSKNKIESMRRKNGAYLLKYILAVNFLEYLEAGAVPALLMQLARAFHMTSGICRNCSLYDVFT